MQKKKKVKYTSRTPAAARFGRGRAAAVGRAGGKRLLRSKDGKPVSATI